MSVSGTQPYARSEVPLEALVNSTLRLLGNRGTNTSGRASLASSNPGPTETDLYDDCGWASRLRTHHLSQVDSTFNFERFLHNSGAGHRGRRTGRPIIDLSSRIEGGESREFSDSASSTSGKHDAQSSVQALFSDASICGPTITPESKRLLDRTGTAIASLNRFACRTTSARGKAQGTAAPDWTDCLLSSLTL